MTRRKAIVWRQVVEELADALQAAIGLSAKVRHDSKTKADDADQLEASITRAVLALKRLQP